MMAKLNHPHIVRILGATRQGCHFNMFVEWMPGERSCNDCSKHIFIYFMVLVLNGVLKKFKHDFFYNSRYTDKQLTTTRQITFVELAFA